MAVHETARGRGDGHRAGTSDVVGGESIPLDLPDALDLIGADWAEVLERCRALETLATERGDMAASYRLVATTALAALADVMHDRDRLRARLRDVTDEYRRHREATMAADVTRAA